jgi:hypothetical protein
MVSMMQRVCRRHPFFYRGTPINHTAPNLLALLGGSMALSFAADIRPLFRDEDIHCMTPSGVALDKPAWMCVPSNALLVYGEVSAGKMPPDEPWSADRVSLFKKWMDAGCPE